MNKQLDPELRSGQWRSEFANPAPESLRGGRHRNPRRTIEFGGGYGRAWRAGDRTRTGDVQLGKLAFYH
jgi:hypothetical protein